MKSRLTDEEDTNYGETEASQTGFMEMRETVKHKLKTFGYFLLLGLMQPI
jgi:hypothetical protein